MATPKELKLIPRGNKNCFGSGSSGGWWRWWWWRRRGGGGVINTDRSTKMKLGDGNSSFSSQPASSARFPVNPFTVP